MLYVHLVAVGYKPRCNRNGYTRTLRVVISGRVFLKRATFVRVGSYEYENIG